MPDINSRQPDNNEYGGAPDPRSFANARGPVTSGGHCVRCAITLMGGQVAVICTHRWRRAPGFRRLRAPRRPSGVR
jgi:hypothetical protein